PPAREVAEFEGIAMADSNPRASLKGPAQAPLSGRPSPGCLLSPSWPTDAYCVADSARASESICSVGENHVPNRKCNGPHRSRTVTAGQRRGIKRSLRTIRWRVARGKL